jgi:hypothetical protein
MNSYSKSLHSVVVVAVYEVEGTETQESQEKESKPTSSQVACSSMAAAKDRSPL